MEESIEEKAKRDAEKLWEEKLKDQFENKMNSLILESMENFEKKISEFEKTINQEIDELADNTNVNINNNNNNNNNFNKIINNNRNNISNSYNNNSKNNYKNNNNNYYNNNNNNNNSNFKYNNNFNNNSNNNFNFNNNSNNNFNYNNNNNNNNNFNNNYNNNNNYNINNNNFNNNNNNNYNNKFNNSNINIENDKILRKKQIDVFNIQNPSFVNLVQFNDTNNLINLILQCLANIKTLIAYYFNPQKEMKILKKTMENPKGAYLGGAFLKFLDNIWKSLKNQYNPYEIHQSLQKLMGNNYYSNDPGFIINFILTQLHNELIQNPNINKVKESLDDNLCLQNFVQFFKLSSTKILSSFSDNYKIKKRCQFCNQIQYLYESSFVLDIFLEANNENNLSSNKINLTENLKTLLINRENKNIVENCINCHAPKTKFVNKYIYTTSEILIININRNKDINCNVSLEYPFQFNGSEINEIVSPYKYELITIIKKYNNNNYFQFVAYCKSFVNKKWYLYNNQNIELVQNENELIDDKNTCLLIYSFINSN